MGEIGSSKLSLVFNPFLLRGLELLGWKNVINGVHHYNSKDFSIQGQVY